MPCDPAKQKTYQCHAWTFTINNYTDKDEDAVKSLSDFAAYVVCGKETGDQGTPHLQGYVYMLKKASKKAVSRVLQRAALFPSRGTDFDNYGYSAKQDLWFKHGTPPCQGQRSDINNVVEMRTMRDVVLEGSNFQALRLMEKRLVYIEEKRDFKPFVVWAYGGTGVGKSRGFHDAFPDVFVPQSFKWWDGYDGHKEVLIDDFRADFCKFHDFIKLIDRYDFRVEFKGGTRQLRAHVMCITSPYHPASVYRGRTEEDIGQLLRRIDRVVLVRKDDNGNEIHEFM